MKSPRVLFLDIETKLLRVWAFGIRQQYLSDEDIEEGPGIISWAAKYRGEKRIYQEDARNSRDLTNDRKLLKNLYKLISEADIIVAHNGDSFDVKVINARLQINGFMPPPPVKTEDTKKMASKTARHTSNKLRYLAKVFKLKNQKSGHSKYPGKQLWIECQTGNMDAWKEMALYNKFDVIVLEELWEKLCPWNGGTYSQYAESGHLCKCGSTELVKNGYGHSKKRGFYERLKCKGCGSWSSRPTNLMHPERRRFISA